MQAFYLKYKYLKYINNYSQNCKDRQGRGRTQLNRNILEAKGEMRGGREEREGARRRDIKREREERERKNNLAPRHTVIWSSFSWEAISYDVCQFSLNFLPDVCGSSPFQADGTSFSASWWTATTPPSSLATAPAPQPP